MLGKTLGFGHRHEDFPSLLTEWGSAHRSERPRALGMLTSLVRTKHTKRSTGSRRHVVITAEVQHPVTRVYQRAIRVFSDRASGLTLKYLAGFILKHLHATAERTLVFKPNTSL